MQVQLVCKRQLEVSMQAYLENELRHMAAPFAEPLPTLLHHTQPQDLSAHNVYEKLPHTNASPVIFLGDALHPMSPFSGKC